MFIANCQEIAFTALMFERWSKPGLEGFNSISLHFLGCYSDRGSVANGTV